MVEDRSDPEVAVLKTLYTLILLSLCAAPALAQTGPALLRNDAGLWAARSRVLYLALEPALVAVDSIRERSEALVGGRRGHAAARACVDYAATALQPCATAPRGSDYDEAAATRTLSDGCGSDLAAASLAVALARVAGVDAYVAVASCDGWASSHDVDIGEMARVAIRLPGGELSLVSGPPGSALALPPCPFGHWLPLVPAHGRIRSLPVPSHVATHRREDVFAAEARVEIQAQLDSVRTELTVALADADTTFPLHLARRTRWTSLKAPYPLPLRYRFGTESGFVAITLTVDGERATLAVDVRVYAPPFVAGTERINRLLNGLAVDGTENRAP